MNTTQRTADRDGNGIPTKWVVWIDDDMGYNAPNWEIDNPNATREESLEQALKHAAEVLARGYPTTIVPVGYIPANSNGVLPHPQGFEYPGEVHAAINQKLHQGLTCPGSRSLGECPAMIQEPSYNGQPVWTAYLYIYPRTTISSSEIVQWFTDCGCVVKRVSAELHYEENEVIDGRTPEGETPILVEFIPPVAAPAPSTQTSKDPESKRSVWLYGPQGTGKTQLAQELSKLLGLTRIIDTEADGMPDPIRHATGTVVVSTVPPNHVAFVPMTIESALTKLSCGQPTFC